METESDLIDFDILDYEEQLIVEREIMMSVMGKFINDKVANNSNLTSIESDLTNEHQSEE